MSVARGGWARRVGDWKGGQVRCMYALAGAAGAAVLAMFRVSHMAQHCFLLSFIWTPRRPARRRRRLGGSFQRGNIKRRGGGGLSLSDLC